MHNTSTLPYIWMLLGSLSFTLMGAFAHSLHGFCPWQVVAFMRSFIILILIGGMTFVLGTKLVFLRPRILWMRSIAGSFSMLCTFYALPRLPLADVLTLTNVFPVWVAILSWPLLRERPSLNVLVAILLGIIGVALVEQPHFETRNWAAFFALLASVFTAVAMLGLHRLHQVAPMAVVMHFSAVSLIFVALAAFGFDSIHEQTIYFDDQVLSLLVGVGIFAAIGQLFLTKAFARGAPTKVAVVSLSHVVFAIAIDVFWWARQINAITYVGIILVVTPTAWLMVQSGKTNKEQNQ